MSKTLVLDVETSIQNKGNPFDVSNKLCLVGLGDKIYDIEYSESPYGHHLQEIRQEIESADLLVGFNIKFDLHWIRRYINDIRFPPVWDCQLGAFILSHQQLPYPSLDKVCNSLGLGSKRNVVDNEYWSIGIDTPQVPIGILTEYLQGDLDITEKLYQYQKPLLLNNKVFKLQCQDLLVLEEMEFNGMIYDTEESATRAEQCTSDIALLDKQILELVPVTGINWNSSDHVSVVLFGGTLRIPAILDTERSLKDGSIKRGTKKGFRKVDMPRLLVPNPKTELLPSCMFKTEADLLYENNKRVKEGKAVVQRIYSVAQDCLREYNAKSKAKEIIDLLLRRAEMDKLLSTYFKGIPEIIQKLNWPKNEVHGNFNMCVAVTGRLSSSKPNQQNFHKEVKYLFRSRYVCP
jgi:DNA polymerase I-like protein with 3'-5' exonuclease and polymerase domains